ncbi:MAG: ATP-dependent DNA helicase DinG [Pseudomonadota bacterium]|nr:ATP-dependent DNA helicase DinG [Pseudomonadota bacterium]
MLADEIKDLIQENYRQVLKTRELTPRYGQRLMIAEIAKRMGVIGGSQVPLKGEPTSHVSDGEPDSQGSSVHAAESCKAPVCVIEAGTGTGKTLAYLLATIPLAQALDLKVVIATATVALQEQVILKDIPELLSGSELDFSVALAKGRGRYVCLSKLDALLEPNESLQAIMDLYGDEPVIMGESDSRLYNGMLDALTEVIWYGDRDSWKRTIAEQEWRPLTVDNASCMGARCSNFRQCVFFKARESLDNSDVIVSNHDLVLSDLALGGGVILPEPANCIYVFDEAHHLPIKSNNHFAASTRIRSTRAWLERIRGLISQLIADDFIPVDSQSGFEKLHSILQPRLEECWQMLQPIFLNEGEIRDKRSRYTFPLGILPPEVRDAAGNLFSAFSQLAGLFANIAEEIKIELEEANDLSRKELAERFYPVIGGAQRRAEASALLWLAYSQEVDCTKPPVARWMTYQEDDTQIETILSASPVLAADNLSEKLWEQCAGAVLTSATLSSLGNFNLLKLKAGLPESTFFLSIPSPFDFGRAATFAVPKMGCEPSDTESHTEFIVAALPHLLTEPVAALMLFSSRRQMVDVMERLPDDFQNIVLCQDDYQKAQLLKYHRQRIDQGLNSLIFGLASFAEGVDLPGHYCEHVLIAKIPFAVPDDPIEITLSAWIEQQGQNSFMTLAVPDAAFRLVQASGRLLRSESDFGRITLFDERLFTKRYGKQILASLPPYRQERIEIPRT